MQKEDLKAGMCVSISSKSDIIEGVVTNVSTVDTTVLCLYDEYKMFQAVFDNDDICDIEPVPIPHFCTVGNLHEVLMKYCEKENTHDVQVLGFVINNNISYYKIGNIFLEIASYTDNPIHNDFPLYVYIKEVSEIEDFDIPHYSYVEYYVMKNPEYFHIENNAIIDKRDFCLYMCQLNKVYNNPVGVTFFNNKWEWCLNLFQMYNNEIPSGFLYHKEMFIETLDKPSFIMNMKRQIIL